jgi:hypothetical protein
MLGSQSFFNELTSFLVKLLLRRARLDEHQTGGARMTNSEPGEKGNRGIGQFSKPTVSPEMCFQGA